MLEVRDLQLSFSGVRALQGAHLTAHEGAITALIGPNGAGKTTAFNCIARVQRADGGSIHFDGEDLLKRHPAELVELGIGRTFQHSSLFESLDVRGNLQVGEHAGRRRHATSSRTIGLDEIIDLLELGEILSRSVESLPLGTQKRVELGRALLAQPRLLMLDEPAGGLTHGEVADLRDLLMTLNETLGISILLVEHHMEMIMSMSNHVVVLSGGRTIAAGSPSDVQADPEVGRVYLGA